jgi:hypothetical protein
MPAATIADNTPNVLSTSEFQDLVRYVYSISKLQSAATAETDSIATTMEGGQHGE